MLRKLTPVCRLGLGARSRRLALLLAGATLIAVPLKAQQNPPQEVSTRDVEPTFKLQAERNLVTVRVTVRNAKGETVDNLHKEDFQLFDRGKKQTIAQFSVEKPVANTPEPEAQKAAGVTPETGGAAGPPPSFNLRRRFVALYFDDVNTGVSGLARARDAADRFLQASLHPGDRVGVFTASGQKPLDFTDDLARVRQALSDLRPHPLIAADEMCGAITPYEAYLISQLSGLGEQNNDVITLVQTEKVTCYGLPTPPSIEEIRMEAIRAQAESEQKATAALWGIESLVRLMTTLPGQRSMVIISDGFMSQTLGSGLSQLADRALRANIVINALDSRGVFVGSVVADASVAGRDLPPDSQMESLKERLLTEEAIQESSAMGTLAQDTGGILYENNNDLEAGFRRVAGTPGTYYTMAFSPENLKHDGAFHPLKVTLVSGKGLTVQARKGYYAPSKAIDPAVQEKEEIQEAVYSQDETRELPLDVQTQFFMKTREDAQVDVLAHVDLHSLQFRKQGDRSLDNLTFLAVVFDQDGHYVTGQQKVLELRLRDATLQKYLRTGITIDLELDTKPGTYLVRVIVRDSGSGEISSLNRTVEIPY
jgi:VWFA-related protein